MSSHDAPTILSAASNQSRRIDADLLLLVDTQGGLIAATDRVEPAFVASMDDLIERALMSPDMPHFATMSGGLYQFFAAPVRAPDTIAWLVMGFAVNDALAQKIGDLVGVDVSFITMDAAGARNVASTLHHELRDLMPALPETGGAAAAVPGKIKAGADEFLVHVVDLEPDNHAVRLLLQKSGQEVLAPFLAVRNAMLMVSGTALLLAIIVAVLLGRSTTRPIDKLVAAARRIEGGQYKDPIAISGSEEFRRLAGTLNAMQERVAEREARIRHQAYHDELTGLPNRAQAEIELARMLSEAGGKSLHHGDGHPPEQPARTQCIAGPPDWRRGAAGYGAAAHDRLPGRRARCTAWSQPLRDAAVTAAFR